MPEIIESEWKGIDQSQEPDNIATGAVQVADNLVLDGRDLITRPGLTAILNTAFTSRICAYTPLVLSGGSERAILAADSGLYYWAGSTSASAVSGAGTVAHAAAQIALLPGTGFLVDGTANLKRITFDSGGAPTSAALVTELNRPATPGMSLVSESSRQVQVRSLSWSQNYITGSTSTPGTSGAGDTIAPTSSITPADRNVHDGASNTAFWTLSGGATGVNNVLDANRDNCVELDNSGETAVTGAILTNADVDGVGYARVAVLEYEAAAEDTASNTPSEVVDFTVTSYTNTGASTGAVENTYRSPLLEETTARKIRVLWDGRGLATVPRSLTMKWVQPFDRPGNFGVDVNRAACYFPRQELALSVDTDNKISVKQGTVQVWNGIGSQAQGSADAPTGTAPYTTPTGRLLTQGLILRATLGSTLDLSAVQTLAMEVLPGAGVSGLQLRLHLKSSSTWYQTASLDIPEGGGWASVDISTLQVPGATTTAQNSILTSVTDVRVEIINDVHIESLQEGGSSTVFRFGDIKEAGNLLVGRNYWYVLAEINSNSDSELLNVIWSDGSQPTSAVAPTDGERMCKLVLPARTNSSADYLAVFRFGGSYLPADGDPSLPTGRVIAWIPWATATFGFTGDTQKPSSPASGYPVVFANPYVKWTKTGSTGDAGSILIDNTPDSWLSGANTYEYNREKAPTAPVAVATWDNRLWLASSTGDVYASWRIEPTRTAGIYWTRTKQTSETDPDAAKKGWWGRLELTPGDAVVKLIPVGGLSAHSLVALTQLSAFVITKAGDTYSVREMLGEDVGGVVGVNGAAVFEDALWWMSPRGLLRWQPGDKGPHRVADQVRRLLPGVSPSATYSTAALALVSLWSGPHFLYLSIPNASGDTAPNRTLVWHGREKGWTRWVTAGTGGWGEIIAGFDGQLKRIGGSGDKATPGSSAAAVSITLQTRRIGEGTVVSNPGKLFYSLNLAGATTGTLTFGLLGDGTDSATLTQTVLGESTYRVRTSRANAGRRHDITLTASTVGRLRVRALGIELIPRHRNRV